jgi:hypothetical protein
MRALLLVFLTAGALLPAPKPDFSGTWKLNIPKSDFGKSPAPKGMTTQIQQNGPEISVHSQILGPQGSYTTDYKWVTDGRENVNTIHGNEVRTTVVWNGSVLFSNAKTVMNGVEIGLIDQWSLSPDGKVMTVTRTVIAPQGNAEQTYVYEK